jgi:hypothetical protein
MRVGDLFFKMYELAEEVARDGIDFATVARTQGKRVLIARLLSADGLAPDEAALDEILSWPLDVLADVTEAERSYQQAHAH